MGLDRLILQDKNNLYIIFMGAILIVTIVKNVEIYSPDNIGKKDVVILFNKIEGIFSNSNYFRN